MFFDALDPDGLTGTPVLVAATAGTARHSLVLDHAMRPLFAYLRAVVVPTGVFAATEDFGSHGLSDRITRAASELAAAVLSQGDYARRRLRARPRRPPAAYVRHPGRVRRDALRRPAPGSLRHRLTHGAPRRATPPGVVRLRGARAWLRRSGTRTEPLGREP